MLNKYTQANAEKYIADNKEKVEGMYRHSFHFMAPIGWINDPNGFSFYKEEYHLFYQYCPYESMPGRMHWGHAKSKDLIFWEHLPVALSPCDKTDLLGCFSGSAIEYKEEHVLIYTGLATADNEIKQRQCLAIGDGVTYNKHPEHIITEDSLPENILKNDFRDPKIFNRENKFYCIVGTKNSMQQGALVMFESDDLYNWKFKNILNQSEEINGGVYECPDYFQLNKRDIMIFSPQYKQPEGHMYHNRFSTMYQTGILDFSAGKFDVEFESEIDFGFDFYAPQTLTDKKGRRIMIAWMQMWDREIPSALLNHNWAGAMTIPRELTIAGNKIYQYPVEEIENYRTELFYIDLDFKGEFGHKNLAGKYVDIEAEIEYQEESVFGCILFQGKDEETIFTIDTGKQIVTFDRSRSGIQNKSNKNELSGSQIRSAEITCHKKVHARFILDNTCVEAFFNKGETAMTGNIYSSEDSKKITFFSDKKIHITIHKYNLESKNK